MQDRFGLDLTTASAAARDAYVLGTDALLGAIPGDIVHLQRALAADSGFALAHIALARAHQLRMALPAARAAAEQALACVGTASERERSQVQALSLLIDGRAAEALDAVRAHIARWPRDAMVAAPATGVFGLFGFSGRPTREDDLHDWLASLAPHYAGDWWFELQYAFACCETGRLDAARRLIERSLAAEPRSGHGAHVRAHVRYEMREARRGLDELQRWLDGYSREGLMHCHLSWHVAMFALELGDPQCAWAVYRDAVHPGASWGPPLNVVTDTCSFLWRAELAGSPRDAAAWREVRDHAWGCFPSAGVVFVDVHKALADAAAGDGASLQRLAGELRGRLAMGQLPAGTVVPALVDALAAYARHDLAAAIAGLQGALPEVVRIGGSRAQRDLVRRTLAAACHRAGRPDDARRALR